MNTKKPWTVAYLNQQNESKIIDGYILEAAPDLLEALQAIMKHAEDDAFGEFNIPMPLSIDAYKAINKALNKEGS